MSDTRWSRLAILLAICTSVPVAPACQEERRTLASPAMDGLSLDALIGALPHVDEPAAAETDLASAELARRLHAGVQLTGEQWKRLLLSTGTLRIRPRWPASEPFTVSMRYHPWLQGHELVLVPQRADVPLASADVGAPLPDCGTVAIPEIARWAHQELGPLPLGPQALPLTLELRRWHELPEPILVATAELRLDVEIVPTLDDALPAHTSPEVDDAVRATLSLGFEHGEAVLSARRGSPDDPRLAGLARALEIEVRRDSEPVAQPVRLWATDLGIFGPPTPVTWARISAVPASLANNVAARARWSIRVRGSDDGILRSWDCDRRWTGEVVIMLDELLARGHALER